VSDRVGIVDYGICNIDSVSRAVEELGATPVVAEGWRELAGTSRLILPGVGAFPDGMRNLRDRGWLEPLREQVFGRRIPTLGICLGMQLLATEGFEVSETEGLDWIPGEVRRLEPATASERVPHIGWNEMMLERDSPLFAGVPSGKDFYFVHSFHFRPKSDQDVIGRTPYCGGFVAAVQRANVFGVQFHLEKSQRPGFQVLRNFLTL